MTLQTQNARNRAYIRQRGLCFYCKKHVPKIGATLEHRIPKCEGGGCGPDNTAMTCAECNAEKGNMPEIVFLQGAEARKAWRDRQAQENRLLNSDPTLIREYNDFIGRGTIYVTSQTAVPIRAA